MTIDLAEPLRRRKPEKKLRQLVRRPDAAMSAAARSQIGALVLDTNVYIASAAGTLSTDLEALLDRSLLFHCSICLAELAVGIANGDPSHHRWKATRDHYTAMMATIPDTRVLIPDCRVWLDAGIISGTLARTQGLQPHQRKDVFHDALIYLTATQHGYPVLTSNRRDFDLLQQLAPEGVVYVY